MVLHLAKELLIALDQQLEEINNNQSDLQTLLLKSIECCKVTYGDLRSIVVQHDFKCDINEIFFFKNIKPKLLALKYRFDTILKIYFNVPEGSIKRQVKYFKKQLAILNRFYTDNTYFCSYIKNKYTHLDHQYFLRGNELAQLEPEFFQLERDPTFSTSHDFKLARYLALPKIKDFVLKEMGKLKKLRSTSDQNEPILNWTGSKTDLVELIYGLHRSNSVKNDIRAITNGLEILFNTKITKLYQTWNEIQSRKGDKAKITNMLVAVINSDSKK